MLQPPSSLQDLSVAHIAALYRRLWFVFLSLGLVSALALLAFFGALLGWAPGLDTQTNLPDVIEAIGVPNAVVGVLLLLCVGRWSPASTIAGMVLTLLGTVLVTWNYWILVRLIVIPSEWSDLSYEVLTIWLMWVGSALTVAVTLLELRYLRQVPPRLTVLASLEKFVDYKKKLGTRATTFHYSRLWWLGPALASCYVVLEATELALNWVRKSLGAPSFSASQQIYEAWSKTNPHAALALFAYSCFNAVMLVTLLTLVIRFFWRFIRIDAATLLADPEYRPIVFLRSFSDDEATVKSKHLFDRLMRRRRRLEEIAVSILAPLRTTIAIGQPGERLPKLGAIRAYYPDAEWQPAILEWMRRAELIVLVAGTTEWTLWELRQAIDNGYTDKLILIVPPESRESCRVIRWRHLADAASGTAWEGRLRQTELLHALTTLIQSEGELLTIRGNPALQSDYELAIQLAAVEVMTKQPTSRPDSIALLG